VYLVRTKLIRLLDLADLTTIASCGHTFTSKSQRVVLRAFFSEPICWRS